VGAMSLIYARKRREPYWCSHSFVNEMEVSLSDVLYLIFIGEEIEQD
jgi:hypothetical protein